MKNIFLLIALTATILATAQNPIGKTFDNNQSISQNLELYREQTQTAKMDTAKLTKKTIVQELPLTKPMDILIDMSGDLIINTWNENKIKVETTIQFEGQNELTDTQWLDKLGVSMKMFGSTIRIKSKTLNSLTFTGFGVVRRPSTLAVFYGNGFILDRVNGERPINLYIPSESVLEIDSEMGFLSIKNDIKSLLLNNNNCQVDVANIGRLRLTGKQGNFNGGTINDGDIQLSYGRFSLKQLNKGTLTSSYSTVEIESLKDVKLNSSNDEIDIDNASIIYGIKNYGNLRINQLSGKLDLQGVNSDIKLRHINPSAQLVKILNRNADLRLSATDVSDFSVDIKGSYNTIYSSFGENTTVDTLTSAEIESVKSMTSVVSASGSAVTVTGTTLYKYNSNTNKVLVPVQTTGYQTAGTTSTQSIWERNRQNPYLKYSAKIGTGNDSLKYQIICTSCVIDFK